MQYALRTGLIANTFALITVFASGRHHGQKPVLSVHLYDRAQVPNAVLRDATFEATRLFQAAGIHVTWEQPLVEGPEDSGLDMTNSKRSGSQNPDERPYLVVRLVRGMPATVSPRALGFALPFAHTGAGVSICYDRVDALARSGIAATPVILGHALAHEIGHVLLRSSEHTAGGLMQRDWSLASWKLASMGLVAFRPEEAERLSAGVARFQDRRPGRKDEPLLGLE
jgi:hypothetical protein